jgi:WD40 repeat protein
MAYMRNTTIVLALFLLAAIPLTAQTLQELEARRIGLPNGWKLTPVGKSVPLGDLPLNISISHNRELLAVTNNGQSTQSIQLIDLKNNQVIHTLEIDKAWLGLRFSADDATLYVSGGNDNRIIRYAVKNKQLVLKDSIVLGPSWPEKISVAGIDVDDTRHLLYAVSLTSSQKK